MKFIKRFLIIFFLIIVLAYVASITSIPKNIILLAGEKINFNLMYGITYKSGSISNKALETVATDKNIKTEIVSIKLFNIIQVKEITVNTIPKTKVVPLGNTVGLKLYINGVLVIGVSEINGKKPYEESGIKEGDVIVEINKKEVTTTKELIQCVNASKGAIIEVTYVREGTEIKTNMEPVNNGNNEYKLGLWVRDGAAGIGTITYYEPETGDFGALGHGIVDSDTDKLLEISSGEIVTTTITSITKGKSGEPRRNKRNN